MYDYKQSLFPSKKNMRVHLKVAWHKEHDIPVAKCDVSLRVV